MGVAEVRVTAQRGRDGAQRMEGKVVEEVGRLVVCAEAAVLRRIPAGLFTIVKNLITIVKN